MLNLIAISYHNIWPFADQKISIFFEMGKYLIRSPIGSGKSFLFFDGPSYALYKSAPRNLLNIQSETGFIKLLFEMDQQFFLIKRILKRGKSKDSCSSQFFSVQATDSETLLKTVQEKELICKDCDIEEILAQKMIPLEEINFKNETDLQQNLTQLLPPYEVFTSTTFLLQDAENIFELQPAKRLEVLKNVFGLLSIDEAKESVAEKRTAIKYQIKSFQDLSNYEKKFGNYLQRLAELFEGLLTFNQLSNELKTDEQARAELKILAEKLSIQGFELSSIPQDFIPLGKEKILAQQAQFQQLQNQLQVVWSQIQELQKNQRDKQQLQDQTERKISSLQTLIEKSDTQNHEQLKKEKNSLLQKIDQLNHEIPLEVFQQFFEREQTKLGLEGNPPQDLSSAYQLIQQLINLGKVLKGQADLQQEKINNNQQLLEREKKQQIQQIQQLQITIEQGTKQIQELQTQLNAWETETKEHATFYCKEIWGYCPCVKEINKHFFDQRELEKQRIQKELETLQIQIKKLESQLISIQKEIDNPNTAQHAEQTLQILTQEKQQFSEQIELIKSFLQHINHSEIEQSYQQFGSLTAESRQLDQKILEQEELLKTLQQHQQDFQQQQLLLQQLLQDQQNLQNQLTSWEAQKQSLQIQIAQVPTAELNKSLETLQSYEQGLDAMQQLLEEYHQHQLKTKQLIEEEGHLNVLYKVLNKELLLYVLGEYLPTLGEIINNYLVNVVDFQIILRLMEDSEKIELEMLVSDEKGTRDIKSLSGGQRTVLKLVWMLAVSSYLQTKVLFLDETINNLDQETVGKVAKMIEDFVQQRTMKFYTITHNSEIQEMNIWDQIIEVEWLKEQLKE